MGGCSFLCTNHNMNALFFQLYFSLEILCEEEKMKIAVAGTGYVGLSIATLDAEFAYKDADFVVIAAPTNYDSKKNFFDTSAVEKVIDLVMQYNSEAIMVIKSTIPVGYTASIREKSGSKNIIFSPEFLRESKALYDNLYPSRIIVGTDMEDERLVEAAHTFAGLLKDAALKEDVEVLYSRFLRYLFNYFFLSLLHYKF